MGRVTRKHISLKTKLAASLRELLAIPHEHAKAMTEEQICSLVHWDHNVLHAVEVNDAHYNLTPRLIREHREKSRTDTATVAKVKRIDAKWIAFMSSLAAGRKPVARDKKIVKWSLDKKGRPKATRSRWPKRSFPCCPK